MTKDDIVYLPYIPIITNMIKKEFSSEINLEYIEKYKDELNFVLLLRNKHLSREDKKYIKKQYKDEILMSCLLYNKNEFFNLKRLANIQPINIDYDSSLFKFVFKDKNNEY